MNSHVCFVISLFLHLTTASQPLFNDAVDPLDFKGKDYYDELQYPDIKNEKRQYLLKPPGGLSTKKPVVKNVSPDIEPANNFAMEGDLIKVGRMQGKEIWKQKTKDQKVDGTKFVVKTEGMGRTIKGLVIDMKNVKPKLYQARLHIENKNYVVTVSSDSPMKGTANVKFYVNPEWKKVGNKKKKQKTTKKVDGKKKKGPRGRRSNLDAV